VYVQQLLNDYCNGRKSAHGLAIAQNADGDQGGMLQSEFFQADKEYIDAVFSLYGIGVHTTC
jgi:hypothetical protein